MLALMKSAVSGHLVVGKKNIFFNTCYILLIESQVYFSGLYVNLNVTARERIVEGPCE